MQKGMIKFDVLVACNKAHDKKYIFETRKTYFFMTKRGDSFNFRAGCVFWLCFQPDNVELTRYC